MKEGWLMGYRAFKDAHPDCPTAESIEILDLIMQRKYAEQIVKGEKKVEFRNDTKFYYDRLYDKKVLDYINKHKDDKEVREAVGRYINPMKMVQSIHFHNYNNTWSLDVEVRLNDYVRVIKEEVDFLRTRYNSHELDDLLTKCEKARHSEKKRPIFYYFALGKIIRRENI